MVVLDWSGLYSVVSEGGEMGPIDTGALEYTPLDDFDHQLIAAREAHQQWDIFHAGHGYLAVPAGATVYMASDVDALVAKLRRHQERL